MVKRNIPIHQCEKFVVLGSCCFSGASFIDYVLRDNSEAEIIGINRSPEYNDIFLPYKSIVGNRFTFYQLNLNNDLEKVVDIIDQFQPDYIVNYAAQGMVGQSWQAPEQWFQTNTLAIMNLVDRLKKVQYLKRYVQISTPEVYGASFDHVREDTPLNPTTPYAASKAGGDLSIIPFIKTFSFPAVFTRASNVYGVHQQLYRIIPRTIINIKERKRLPLRGGGKSIKSYIHIKDVSCATLHITRNGENGEVYHIAPEGEGISIADLVEKICNKMNVNFSDCVEIVGERLGNDAAYRLDSSKLRKSFSWEPMIDLDTGLQESISWVEKNFKIIQNIPQEYIHKP
jgi:dTDP-glucose 4,6-dehydratase